MHEYIRDYGHCCNTCKHYNVATGYCNKTNKYHYGYDYTYGDGKCPNWIIADDLVEHRTRRNKTKSKLKIERIKLV